MKKLITLIAIAVCNIAISQEDWKIPKVNGKFQLEYNSNKINTGKKDLCDIYFGRAQAEMSSKLIAAMANGKVKFWSASSYTIFPQMYGADASTGNMASYMQSQMEKCKPNSPDTLFGSLTISLSQVSAFKSSRNGTVKVLFRIILNDNSYNLKFRGFDYTYFEQGSAFKPGKMVVKDLEDEYNEANAKKSDKRYWADIKMIIGLFHNTLEESLSSQASDFNFDD